MPLTPGTRLGVYEVVSAIGKGGMGEVWKARDTKLGREVALKTLPDAFAHDPARLARFQREAQVLASLNHPNIGGIYGLEDAGQPFLVLELVEGVTLAERLGTALASAVPSRSEARQAVGVAPHGRVMNAGPIPLDEALNIARQIAQALEAAHEAGVVHRDLKPANIKLRPDGTVKVLDFGLAKALDPSAGPEGAAYASQSPTITTPAQTMQGVILGTAAYMSPEQARGRPVDRRSDIWAFGCVLYEMLTGERAFQGEDVAVTLARVAEREPDFEALPASLPSRVHRVLRACLQKDPKLRVADVQDLRLALAGVFDTVDAAASTASVRT